MKEILGNNLKLFFDTIDFTYSDAELMYKGREYEVWEVSDNLYDKMCSMTEETFFKLAGEDACWRWSSGSVINDVIGDCNIHGYLMQGWIYKPWNDHYNFSTCYTDVPTYSSLTEYLCDHIGASTLKNVCALAMDLAKYNDMTMAELFNKYEGCD